jgi:hypothetical protein
MNSSHTDGESAALLPEDKYYMFYSDDAVEYRAWKL